MPNSCCVVRDAEPSIPLPCFRHAPKVAYAAVLLEDGTLGLVPQLARGHASTGSPSTRPDNIAACRDDTRVAGTAGGCEGEVARGGGDPPTLLAVERHLTAFNDI